MYVVRRAGPLERRESTNCDSKATTENVADALGDITTPVTELHRHTMSSFDSICRTIEKGLVKVRKSLKKAFACEARIFPHGVRETVRVAAESTREWFVNKPRRSWQRLASNIWIFCRYR